MARRLQDLPVLRSKFAEGALSLDQVDAISKLATAETEEGLVEECLGLSMALLDRAGRRAQPPGTQDELDVWERRALFIQHSLDGMEARSTAHLPGSEMHIVESAIRERADAIPPNPETAIFDPYPARLADGLVELAATSGDSSSGPSQMTVHADLDALTHRDHRRRRVGGRSGDRQRDRPQAGLRLDRGCAVYDHARALGGGRRPG